jgi:hypothetical protein
MFEYDKTSKWDIQHHGDLILWMARVEKIATWTSLQAELISPPQLPDGVLSVLEHGQTAPDTYILEIATFPDARVPSQAVRDTALALLERGVLPEVVIVYLHEKGNVRAADSVELISRKGFTRMNLWWKAVKLWELPAEELLSAGDAALLPWAPLTKFSDPPETVIGRCRARIDRETSSPEREDLLTVAQFLLKLRYDEKSLKGLQNLLGGREVMEQSTLYQEIVEEAKSAERRQAILDLLEIRFGPEAKDLEAQLESTTFERLRELYRTAVKCRSLASFRKRLLSS